MPLSVIFDTAAKFIFNCHLLQNLGVAFKVKKLLYKRYLPLLLSCVHQNVVVRQQLAGRSFYIHYNCKRNYINCKLVVVW